MENDTGKTETRSKKHPDRRQGDLPKAILDEKRDPLRLAYRKDIARAFDGFPPKKEEETAMFDELARLRAACGNDATARDAFERMKRTIAARYLPIAFFDADYLREHGCPLEFMDLVQEGNLALLKAVDGYDSEKTGSKTGRKARFGTYASTAVWRAMERAADEDRRARTPAKLEKKRKTGPADATSSGGPVPEKNEPIDPDSLPAPSRDNPFCQVEMDELCERIRQILETLTDRERTILSLRFGLEDAFARALAETRERMGARIDRERLRQIEAKAIRKLPRPARLRRLKTFLDDDKRKPSGDLPDRP